MKIKIRFFLLLFFVVCSQHAHAQFTSKGNDFFINNCSKEIFYSQSLEIVRRYQGFEKNALMITKDKAEISKIVKEKISIEDDELFLHRRQRDDKLFNQDDKLRYKFIDLSFDIVRISSLRVFSEYRFGGDDVRLTRRLYESCLDVVNELIISKNQ